MFDSFGFVAGITFGLAIGSFVGIVIIALLKMGSDNVNDIIINASYQMPIGYILIMYVYHGQIRIKVRDVHDNDTGYVDNPDLEIDARLLLAEAHAVNIMKYDEQELSHEKAA